MSADLATWWADLGAAALVGTARRPVPPLPGPLGGGRAGAAREVALLDAAALAGTARRAGVRARPRRARRRRRPTTSARRAPARAVQLLELLVRQPPVGARLAPDLVRLWLDTADASGRRLPHHLLPELLELATAKPALRPGVRRGGRRPGHVAGRGQPGLGLGRGRGRGGRRASRSTRWRGRASPPSAGPLRSTRLRHTDPDAARGLVESTWATDAAADRAVLLDALRTGLGPADEPFLEAALDDRGAKVRELAAALLDALPGSARAHRMAERLRPLLQSKGLVRRTLEVELPLDPDPAGVRDGLTRPKRVGSVRGWWLQRLAAGAPLDVWTDATGSDPASTWRKVASQDARVGIAEAVLARRDATWAAALVEDVWHPALVGLVPPEQRDQVAASQLARATSASQVVAVVSAVPRSVGAGLQPGGPPAAPGREGAGAAARPAHGPARHRPRPGHPPGPRDVGRLARTRRPRPRRPGHPVPRPRPRDPGGLPMTDPTPSRARGAAARARRGRVRRRAGRAGRRRRPAPAAAVAALAVGGHDVPARRRARRRHRDHAEVPRLPAARSRSPSPRWRPTARCCCSASPAPPRPG